MRQQLSIRYCNSARRATNHLSASRMRLTNPSLPTTALYDLYWSCINCWWATTYEAVIFVTISLPQTTANLLNMLLYKNFLMPVMLLHPHPDNTWPMPSLSRSERRRQENILRKVLIQVQTMHNTRIVLPVICLNREISLLQSDQFCQLHDCCSHYAERLARLKQVPIFKFLARPGRDSNHTNTTYQTWSERSNH